MTLLAPLSEEGCKKLDVCRVLGAAQVKMTKYCATGKAAEPLIITCGDQKDALELTIGTKTIEVPNQCSTTPTPYDADGVLNAKIVLGCKSSDPRFLSAIMDRPLTDDPLDDDYERLNFTSGTGKAPSYWEVIIEPLEGSKPSKYWQIVILFATATSKEQSIMFSVDKDRSITIDIMGHNHPDENSKGYMRFLKEDAA